MAASKTAGHRDLEMTGEYTVAPLKRQDELACRIQDKLAKAAKRSKWKKVVEIKAKDVAS